jgi:hypothetical protein
MWKAVAISSGEVYPFVRADNARRHGTPMPRPSWRALELSIGEPIELAAITTAASGVDSSPLCEE